MNHSFCGQLCRYAFLFTLQLVAASAFPGQVQVTSVPFGYTVSSVDLGVTITGALAVDGANERTVYLSYGSFVAQRILKVNTDTGTTQAVTHSLGAIGGIAMLANGDLAITESLTSDTILRAHDLNSNGNFLDAGEVTELIAPVQTEFGDFTGAQVAVAPPGNVSAIPSGALLVQTADGMTSSELLVIQNPETAPTYRPVSGSYYSGYQYNGGFAFDSAGNIIFGISQWNFNTWTSSGRIMALVNSNGDSTIGTGESHLLMGEAVLNAGLSDLAVSKEGFIFHGENSGAVKRSQLPSSLLTGTATTPEVFLNTDSVYISAIRLDRPARSFAPAAQGPRARMYVAAYDATNLLVIEPVAPSAVEDWQLFQ